MVLPVSQGLYLKVSGFLNDREIEISCEYASLGPKKIVITQGKFPGRRQSKGEENGKSDADCVTVYCVHCNSNITTK